jgi:hypothetical protein
MSYRNLPPGRLRRMTYSLHLENLRNRRTLRHLTLSPIIRISNLQQNISRINFLDNEEFSYNRLVELKDVKIGLLSENLLKNSIVENNKNKNNFCVICQDDIDIDEIIRKIKCEHSFHISCLDNWFVENKKCPMCKFEL